MKTFVLTLVVLSLATFCIASQTVKQIVTDKNGNAFEVTITCPGLMDARALDFVRDPSDVELDARPKIAKPLDLTGYHFSIKAQQFATCKSLFEFRQRVPAILRAGGSFTVTADFPEDLDSTFFPTVGNVNFKIYAGNKLCIATNRQAGRLDSSGCYNTGCFNNNREYYVNVYNASNSIDAKFVGAIIAFFINP